MTYFRNINQQLDQSERALSKLFYKYIYWNVITQNVMESNQENRGHLKYVWNMSDFETTDR